MKQNAASKFSAVTVAIVIAVVLLAGGGFFIYKRNAQKEATVSREHLQAALENMKARAENPDQKPFREKNMSELKSRLSPSYEGRTRTLQAGIVFFDLGTGNTWQADQYNEFAQGLLSIFSESPKTAEEKRSRILAFQLAKRILPHTTDASLVKRVDDLISEKRADVYESALFLDLGSQLLEAPAHFVEAHAKCLASKDLGVAQSCLQMIEQVKSSSTREKLAKALLSKWPSLNESLQPYAVKTLISQHAFLEPEAKKLLELSSKKTGEIWNDVFIFGVAELGAVEAYRAQLDKIAASAETTSLRQRASELLQKK